MTSMKRSRLATLCVTMLAVSASLVLLGVGLWIVRRRRRTDAPDAG